MKVIEKSPNAPYLSTRTLATVVLLLFFHIGYSANNDWQGQLHDHLKMTQITMPGTHNSATSVASGITILYSKCQSTDIASQLNSGIRALDIRCEHSSNRFNIVHGSVSMGLEFGAKVRDVCINFLRNNPSEFIFMTIKPEGTESNNSRSFEETLKAYIDEYPEFFVTQEGVHTVKEIRGKIVLFRRFGSSIYPMGNQLHFQDNTTGTSNSSITARIQDHYNTGVSFNSTTKINDMKALFEEAMSGNENTLYVNFASGTATFSNPGMVANSMRPLLVNYLNGLGTLPPKRLGVVYLDFAADGQSIVDLLIRHNLRHEGISVSQADFPFQTSTVTAPKWYKIVNNRSDTSGGKVISTQGINAACTWDEYDGRSEQLFRFEAIADKDSFRIVSRANEQGRLSSKTDHAIHYSTAEKGFNLWGLRKLADGQYLICSSTSGGTKTLHAQIADALLVSWDMMAQEDLTNINSGSSWRFEAPTPESIREQEGTQPHLSEYPVLLSTASSPIWYAIVSEFTGHAAPDQVIELGATTQCNWGSYEEGRLSQLFRFEKAVGKDSIHIIAFNRPTGGFSSKSANPIRYTDETADRNCWAIRKLKTDGQYLIVGRYGNQTRTLHSQIAGNVLVSWDMEREEGETNQNSRSAWSFRRMHTIVGVNESDTDTKLIRYKIESGQLVILSNHDGVTPTLYDQNGKAYNLQTQLAQGTYLLRIGEQVQKIIVR